METEPTQLPVNAEECTPMTAPAAKDEQDPTPENTTVGAITTPTAEQDEGILEVYDGATTEGTKENIVKENHDSTQPQEQSIKEDSNTPEEEQAVKEESNTLKEESTKEKESNFHERSTENEVIEINEESVTEYQMVDVKGCAYCKSKKVRIGCANKACKQCCVRMEAICDVHSKKNSRAKVAMDPGFVMAPKVKKRVLKNEFRETSFHYYDETVTVFCVNDFFASKKLSQSILNVQSRSLRVNGSYTGRQVRQRKAMKDQTLKHSIRNALQKSSDPTATIDAVLATYQ